ncbi:MAG: WcaF family extracellular polysaccharide biosynthesis acetyltransferase [Cyanobacteriota bacterium]|nr:WcaF family extracellular polysaccharide biosynthesis acetyltransferase [Cyanobacteriota bacterium]
MDQSSASQDEAAPLSADPVAATPIINPSQNLGILSNQDAHTQASFSLSNRLARVVWSIGYVLLFRPSPRPLHEWRSFLLRCFGAKVGKCCHVYPSAKIWAPWNLELADYVGIGDEVTCYSMAKIRVGDHVVISQGSHLCTGSHDYEDPNFPLYAEPIEIEDRVWVCAEAFVCPGITIATGAVIGARSVVTKNMPAWMVCAGHPCRPIKPRILKDKNSVGQ